VAGGFREDRRHRQLAVGEHLADRRQADRANTSPSIKPTRGQLRYLRRGLGQPAGKLPLFDEVGGAISPRTIRSCVKQGWAESWITNPIKPDWLVCRLTPQGRKIADDD